MENADHSTYSSLLEKILEHIFLSEILGALWLHGRRDIEVSRSEVDRGGHDLIIDCNGVTRHIQLKAAYNGAKTGHINLNLDLASKPSGCVIWLRFDKDTMVLGPFYFFGGAPGEKLPNVSDCAIVKHSKGDSKGVKKERSNHRVIKKAMFSQLDTIDDLINVLFGIKEFRKPLPKNIESKKRLGKVSEKVKIVFDPDDEKAFKAELLIKKRAYVYLHYMDGRAEKHIWNASKFTETSNLRFNIATGYLRNWSEKGIVKAVFSIHELHSY